ncbi:MULTISPECIES: ParB/Srx family N-terminal domain-containing protein [unclassified Bradyrhizobium]|uniref:ParB/Srx family N-terminal domain-containing protein n=1 Tax=unclassified Bradyrhizobium TaxID=2631580 RepID=UPI001FF95B8B|nr:MULTISPECIES: ParB/Srx family N-terminal domain-containing protein [unclassified Bradyrhizobium]
MKKQLTNGAALRHNLNPVLVPIGELSPLGHQTRRHPQSQIEKLAASLREFGFVLPIIVDAMRRVVAGWAMVLAAKLVGLDVVPTVTIVDLSEVQLRVLKLTLNRLVEDASWDVQALRLELTELLTIDPQIDLQLTGFSTGELDVVISDSHDLEDEVPPPGAAPGVTQPGDLWGLGEHRLVCADARQAESYVRLMQGERAGMMFADPPFNVPIAGHASGLGKTKHGNFAMAAGEMSAAEFQTFLAEIFAQACAHSMDGAIHFICSD